ncbi:MAG: hypothetical protein F6K23_24485 [Okeania sp. SIO2C9]|uniref:hypothetical protein n=1 Tax=Okeania sp. SIO2C9 TaxID=2607791 RepID=UPI0013C1DF00|nr:hypothetical protein [Okeania sp. SIO2C9]NEQ75911.1 hypothetical protein [Okeania sp. SIO2C9]
MCWICEYSDRFYMNNIDTVDGVKNFLIVTFPAKSSQDDNFSGALMALVSLLYVFSDHMLFFS